ncbi:ABC transporter substrate-binding protein [Prosthecobacter fluviatilis]|uniref:Extracellular solute-binding protein n=1 Tax=Prosthecobacter fluviatilis TaxID=445931 RepID=A0ABW0KU78_9BACT
MSGIFHHPRVQALLSWAQGWRKELAVFLLMLATLAGPFLLKPTQSTAPARYDRRLVIITPHHDRIREEFGHAFAAHWKQTTGQTVFLDWRVPGGTSEIAMLIKSEALAAFQLLWETKLHQPWSPAVAQACLNPKAAPDDPARKAYLASTVGTGIDLFFGGGAYDFEQQARMGTLVAGDGEKTGLSALAKQHPAWFSDAGIPEKLSGEPFRDPQHRWCGACLSSSGIVFNRDVLRRLGIAEDPATWADLADPSYYGQIALSDPGKSGSVTKALEMIIQQEMQKAHARLLALPKSKLTPEQIEAQAVAEGWNEGLRLILRISANARYFTDFSTKIPLEVAKGDAAAGMCIDFYGRSAEEDVRRADGTSRVGFIAPLGGTSVSVDPIGLLRGAPDAELATAFMEFVLGDAGQKLWSYRVGEPGGPREHALRRLPVRHDLYTPENIARMSDGKEAPFEKAQAFTYHPERTAALFNTIRFLVRVICVDSHAELHAAWKTLIDHGMPERAVQVLEDLARVKHEAAAGNISKILSARDKVQETRLARELGDAFRNQFIKAARIAESGR